MVRTDVSDLTYPKERCGRKNKKNNGNRNRITDDILLKALIENNFNMRQSLLQIGLAAKGGNYIRCHRLKNEYEELI